MPLEVESLSKSLKIHYPDNFSFIKPVGQESEDNTEEVSREKLTRPPKQDMTITTLSEMGKGENVDMLA